MTKQWYLSNDEVADLIELTDETIVTGDKRRLRYLAGKWHNFYEWLVAGLEAEKLSYEEHPEDWYVPFDEVAYIAHWQGHLETCRVLIKAINLYLYESVK